MLTSLGFVICSFTFLVPIVPCFRCIQWALHVILVYLLSLSCFILAGQMKLM